MTRYLSALGLAAVTLGCGVAHAPESSGTDPGRLASSESCPAVATTCPAGCFAVGAHPVDRANRCELPRQTFGCSPFDLVGPPALACSVAPDGTIWLSYENRPHPQGRACSDAEREAFDYPSCGRASS